RESHDQLEDALSQLKSAQERMMQQERLAAVGQLAAGIAHDFNNILATILGHAEVLLHPTESREALQSGLQAISSAGGRAVGLVRQLLDFSRKSIRKTEHLDLTSTVAEALRYLRRTIPENIRIKEQPAAGEYVVEADLAQIHHVIANLVLNARDAMPDGGEVRVELSRIEARGEERCAACDERIFGEWVCLSVVDSGSGIAPEVASHIFEPFYTTKDSGEGTGLGLSQVYGIVSQHGGHITVHSEQGEGAVFTIYLPPADQSSEAEDEGIQPAILKGHGETILLVEDEPDVLEAKARMLTLLDYTVITATNGREALTAYREHQAEVALVLSDMVMPDMAGEALFHALKTEDQHLKMVMMSGYPLGEKGATLLEEGVVAWFEKPISMRELSQIVGSALA
ncbi:MAG: response regulator, partial [Spirochaetaceae bacterium]|nr:response regulator [Spirochaetaceae bacterium]